MSISTSDLESIWRGIEIEKNDSEVMNGAHRFHWILDICANQCASQDNLKKITDMIDIWLILFSDQKGLAWHPYNVSERICNWLIFNDMIDLCDKYKKKLYLSINEHAKFLAYSLEYPSSGIINNHILNNARALYLSGQYLGNQSLSSLGRSMFYLHLIDMVDDGGFLIESSSHYQLLLTRSILEVRLISKVESDNKFLEWIEPISEKMLNASCQLAPLKLKNLNDFPKIGDVSPDMPVSWFNPGIHTSTKSGWNKICNVPKKSHKNIQLNTKYGWVSLQKKNWFLITYSHPSRISYPFGHGHDDFGSFCLFFQNIPIIVDIGKLSYDRFATSNVSGSENFSHNTLLLDNKGVVYSGNGIRSIISGVSIENTQCYLHDKNTLNWSGRQFSGKLWMRSLTLVSSTEIKIHDSAKGCKSVKGYLYFHPDVQLEMVSETEVFINLGKHCFIISFIGVNTCLLDSTLYFSDYGNSISSKRIFWESYSKKMSHAYDIRIIKMQDSIKS